MKFLKKWFARKKQPEPSAIPDSQVITDTENQRVEAPLVTAPAAISRREARLKRLQSVKTPPQWVLSEIEELMKRAD